MRTYTKLVQVLIGAGLAIGMNSAMAGLWNDAQMTSGIAHDEENHYQTEGDAWLNGHTYFSALSGNGASVTIGGCLNKTGEAGKAKLELYDTTTVQVEGNVNLDTLSNKGIMKIGGTLNVGVLEQYGTLTGIGDSTLGKVVVGDFYNHVNGDYKELTVTNRLNNDGANLTVTGSVGSNEHSAKINNTKGSLVINGNVYTDRVAMTNGNVTINGSLELNGGWFMVTGDGDDVLQAENVVIRGNGSLYGSKIQTDTLKIDGTEGHRLFTVAYENQDALTNIGKLSVNTLVLEGDVDFQHHDKKNSLEINRVVLNTTSKNYFQSYGGMKLGTVEVVGGVARIDGYAKKGTETDYWDIPIEIGTVQVKKDASLTFSNTVGTGNSRATIDTVVLEDGASFKNAAFKDDGTLRQGYQITVNNLSAENAAIATIDGSTIIGTLTGSGNTIESVTADGTGVLITKNESDNLNYIVADGDSYGSTQEALEAGAGKIESSTSNYTVKTLDDLVNGEGSAIFDSNGNQIYSAAQESRTMTALKQFSNATLVQWRYETNHLSDRLGEVRSNLGTAGAWARVYGADTKVTDNVTTDVKTNTIQVGSDATVGNWIIGGAFSYTSMDGDISNGAADGETYSLAAYASGFFDCGGYLDVIGRIGRMSTDIKASSGTGKLFDGSYDNTAFGLSLEAGYHWDLSQTFFVEPQAELSYGYVLGDDFTTSTPNRVKVEQDDFQSLVGRIGARFGAAFPEKAGTFYVQASVNHEFLGDNDFDATPEGGTRRSFNSELDGTWISYGVGFQINATDALGVYGSLSRANGDDYQDDYRYSVGMRYVF